MQRALELVVNKKISGVSLNGYPRTYRLGGAFGNYIQMTNAELAETPVAVYQDRLKAFKTYVESVETGLTVDISDAYRKNLTECPIIQD